MIARFLLCFLSALLATAFASVPARAQPKGRVMGDFKVPDVDETGHLKSVLMGKQARMVPGQPVMIDGLSVEFYDRAGAKTMLITSPKCTYDYDTGKARSSSEVQIEGKGYTVQGVGFEYQTKDQRMQIFSEAKVTIKRTRSLDVSPVKENQP